MLAQRILGLLVKGLALVRARFAARLTGSSIFSAHAPAHGPSDARLRPRLGEKTAARGLSK